ncbi:MAG: sulfotransferase [Cyanobacteria bacterium]|nr:sulfotransferase [Cyanobacteriota bacterium]MDA1020062.1 sulfotransferase [Cyanobacteriota bacterium]
MQTSKPPLIHIGYHKTASSWLQANLFDDYGFKRFIAQSEIRDRIVLPNALDFKATELRSYYDSCVTNGEFVSVISNERLSGNPHSGGYDSKELADRLYASFPEAKVLIVIREQVSAIFSSYIQYIRVGGPCSIDDYLEPTVRNIPILPLFNFEHFNYCRLVSYYYDLFGKDKVLVLPFELFKNNPVGFCSKITDFTGLAAAETLPFTKTKNKRISSLSSMFLRQSNKLFAKTRLNPSALGKKQSYLGTGSGEGGSYGKILAIDSLIPKSVHEFFDDRLNKIIQETIGDRYQKVNQELAELTGLDLAAYGYCSKQSELVS